MTFAAHPSAIVDDGALHDLREVLTRTLDRDTA